MRFSGLSLVLSTIEFVLCLGANVVLNWTEAFRCFKEAFDLRQLLNLFCGEFFSPSFRLRRYPIVG
jgi:hypothetical protein